MRLGVGILSLALLTLGCKPQGIKPAFASIEGEWTYGNSIALPLEIPKPGTYRLQWSIRHSEEYPFSNLWLKAGSPDSGCFAPDSIQTQIVLAEGNGRWLGRGLGSIHDYVQPRAEIVQFNRAGICTLMVSHNMRTDVLPGVMEVGIRLTPQ